eukprot:sb/3465414/
MELGKKGLFEQFCGACESCGMGSHDCTAVVNQPTTNVAGFVWICFDCVKKHTLEQLTELEEEEVSTPRSAASVVSENNLKRKFSEPETGLAAKTGDNKKPDDSKDGDNDEQPYRVCQYYLQKSCRHGWSGKKKVNGKVCTRSHPPKCRKYCNYGSVRKYGCQKGTKCRYFHPPICKSSELSHQCLKTSCKFQHLRGTRRSLDTGVSENPNQTMGVVRPSQSFADVTMTTTETRPRSPQTSGQNAEMQPVNNDFLDRLFFRLETRLEDLLDDSHGFPAAEFDVISGSLQASFDHIPAGTNVSHAVVLLPKVAGAHNFIPAMVNYKNSNGEDLVTFSSFLDNNPILSIAEYNRKHSPHLVDWLIFVGLCTPVLLIPFLTWHSSHSKYEALASKAKKS